MASSKLLGAVRDSLGIGGGDDERSNCVPIDRLVEVLARLAFGLSEENKGRIMRMFQPIHSIIVSWESFATNSNREPCS